ncbi:uncharacterized protein LOC113352278 [Papaver somniferum]|uniref:uncharacterized protein LOC113352278 n=1 Tax=Papaver somniferum TaxID=3469 RepID=UPI000E6F8B33|nr:uncharacterized protein LOC113352278 [Papaver somniferum]
MVIWNVSKSAEFSVKETYKSLLPHKEYITWNSLVWFRFRIPRPSFIAWVTLHGKLMIRDKLVQWKVITISSCLLCDAAEENENHLFHGSEFAGQVWSGLILKMGYLREICSTWQEEIQWYVSHFWGKSCVALIKLLIFNSFIYNIWRERNSRIFEVKYNSIESMSFLIVQEVRLKLSAHKLKDEESDAIGSSWIDGELAVISCLNNQFYVPGV